MLFSLWHELAKKVSYRIGTHTVEDYKAEEMYKKVPNLPSICGIVIIQEAECLENLLNVHYNYDFMNSRQNFPNTWVHKKLGKTNKSRFISSFLCVCILVCGTGRWWVQAGDQLRGLPGRTHCGDTAHETQGGLAAGLPIALGEAMLGSLGWPWCPRWAGLAVRGCSQAAVWGLLTADACGPTVPGQQQSASLWSS